MKQKPTHWIRKPLQIRALESPMRQEIVDALSLLGPSSISDLAGHLGKSPDALYFHIRRLEKVGIIMEKERVKSGRNEWAVYEIPGRDVRIEYDRAQASSISRVVAAANRQSIREFSRALRNPSAKLNGPERNLWGGRVKGRLTREDLHEVNELFTRLLEIMHRHDSSEPSELHTLAWVFSPVMYKPKSKQK